DELVLVTKISYLTSSPARGDVTVISKPSEQREDLVKRVIGLPNETIEMRDGKVYINGIGLDESSYIVEPDNYSMPPIVLGDKAYFVLGDNRRESEDSRRFGPVPAAAIIGKLWLRYWPPKAFGFLPEQAPTREPLPVRTDSAAPSSNSQTLQPALP
ncbi:MAG: signal peptidase I, partial [Chloroflexota bacterium]|nr:signal peptidase I [Chloroflexota bacterium]